METKKVFESLKPKKRRVLVIDDNEDILRDYTRIFDLYTTQPDDNLQALETELFEQPSARDEGVNKIDLDLSYASQGQEGYSLVKQKKQAGEPIQVAFVDMRMPPGWDGLETIEKIWQVDPDIEVVICSAYSDYSLDQIIERLGYSDQLLYLKKPFSSIEVRQMAICLSDKWYTRASLKSTIENQEQIIRQKQKELEDRLVSDVNNSRLATIGMMAGGIAHEINNPLMISEGYLRKVRKVLKEHPEALLQVNPLLGKLDGSTQLMIEIVRGFKMLTSPQSRPRVSQSVREILENTIVLARNILLEKDVEISVADFGDISIECIPAQIIQVIFNLISNSCFAVAELDERWIKVQVSVEAGWCQIKFTDSGPGIPQEIRDKIMDPFFTTKQDRGGTGLGLSLCKDIITDHEGRLVLSGESKNTEFLVQIPAGKAS